MSDVVTFAAVVEAAEQLDAESQAELIEILRRRLAEKGRERIVATVAEARQEYQTGQCQSMDAAEIVREAMS